MLTPGTYCILAPVNLGGCNTNTHTKEKRPHHSSNLRETFIEQGIELIHERGIRKFSLRKVTKQVGVSAIICYNHFGNIDELLRGMYSYVVGKFTAALKQAVEGSPRHSVTISTGMTYAELFAGYPHYFNFSFDSEYPDIQIKETEVIWNNSSTPFEISVNSAKRGVRELNIGEKGLRDDLLVMWATVYSLAAVADTEGVQYGNGDRGALTERILLNEVIL